MTERTRGWSRVAGIAVSAVMCAAVASPTTAQERPSFGAGATVRLPFVNREPGTEIKAPPKLIISFGGRPRRAVIDTGSTGVVVSATAIPGVDQLPTLGPARLAYSSSGRVMVGDWVLTSMSIAGADGTRVETGPIPVIAVRRIECFSNARNCVPSDNPTHVSMVGIGFARQGDHQPQGTADRNPLLNLTAMATAKGGPTADGRTMRRGYLITRDGLQVGLSAGTTGDFALVKLNPDPTTGDWSGAPMCARAGDSEAACGTVLVDTGVTNMFLTLPDSALAGRLAAPQADIDDDDEPSVPRPMLAPGTQLSFDLGGKGPGRVSYRIAVGEGGNAMAPGRVVLVSGANRRPFVNTSVHLLNGFDYLFDAEQGYVGYRWTGRLAPGLGQAAP